MVNLVIDFLKFSVKILANEYSRFLMLRMKEGERFKLALEHALGDSSSKAACEHVIKSGVNWRRITSILIIDRQIYSQMAQREKRVCSSRFSLTEGDVNNRWVRYLLSSRRDMNVQLSDLARRPTLGFVDLESCREFCSDVCWGVEKKRKSLGL